MASNYKISITVDGNDNASGKLRDIDDALGRMDGKPGGLASQFGSLQNAVDGVLAVGFVKKFGQAVVELNKLGQEIGPTQKAFVELNGDTATANLLLEDMRESAGGIVNNFALMNAANAMKLTGVVESNEDISKLTGNVVKLGAALGQEATASIENFNAALLNNSYERLDTLGVSASNVRLRVAELKEEGYEMSEAFAQATIEQMEVSVARLGTAAGASATAFAQLETRIENNTQKLGMFVATAGEAGAQLALMSMDGHIDDFFQVAMGGQSDAVLDWAESTARMYADELMAELGDSAKYDVGAYEQAMAGILADPERGFGDVLMDMGVNTRTANPEVYDQLVQAMEFAQDRELANKRAADHAAREAEVLAAFGDQNRRQFGHVAGDVAEFEALMAAEAEKERAKAARESLAAMDRGAEAYLLQLENQRQLGVEETRAAFARDLHARQAMDNAAGMYLAQLENQRLQGEITAATDASAVALANAMNLAAGGVREFNGMEIATQGAANEASRLAEEAALAYEQAQNLGLEGAELDSFKQAADDTKRIADEMGRAAENLATMNLEQALGSGTDATQNLLRDVLEASGLERDQAMVVTGETSGAEVRFEEEVAPLLESIRTEMGDEAGNEAATRFVEAYRAGLEGGLGEDAALNMAVGGLGFGMDGGQLVEQGGAMNVAQLTGANDAQGAAGLMGMQDRSGDMVTGVAATIGGEMGAEGGVDAALEMNTALETRSGLMSDIQNTMLESTGLMSDTSLGLDTSLGAAEDIQSELNDMNGRQIQINILYKIKTDGKIPPGGSFDQATFVPVTDGEM